MNQKQQLLRHIANLEAQVGLQQKKFDVTTKCLAETEAAIAVSKIAAKANRTPLLPKELEELDNAMKNSVDSVTQALLALGQMRSEVSELRNALSRLPD